MTRTHREEAKNAAKFTSLGNLTHLSTQYDLEALIQLLTTQSDLTMEFGLSTGSWPAKTLEMTSLSMLHLALREIFFRRLAGYPIQHARVTIARGKFLLELYAPDSSPEAHIFELLFCFFEAKLLPNDIETRLNFNDYLTKNALSAPVAFRMVKVVDQKRWMLVIPSIRGWIPLIDLEQRAIFDPFSVSQLAEVAVLRLDSLQVGLEIPLVVDPSGFESNLNRLLLELPSFSGHGAVGVKVSNNLVTALMSPGTSETEKRTFIDFLSGIIHPIRQCAIVERTHLITLQTFNLAPVFLDFAPDRHISLPGISTFITNRLEENWWLRVGPKPTNLDHFNTITLRLPDVPALRAKLGLEDTPTSTFIEALLMNLFGKVDCVRLSVQKGQVHLQFTLPPQQTKPLAQGILNQLIPNSLLSSLFWNREEESFKLAWIKSNFKQTIDNVTQSNMRATLLANGDILESLPNIPTSDLLLVRRSARGDKGNWLMWPRLNLGDIFGTDQHAESKILEFLLQSSKVFKYFRTSPHHEMLEIVNLRKNAGTFTFSFCVRGGMCATAIQQLELIMRLILRAAGYFVDVTISYANSLDDKLSTLSNSFLELGLYQLLEYEMSYRQPGVKAAALPNKWGIRIAYQLHRSVPLSSEFNIKTTDQLEWLIMERPNLALIYSALNPLQLYAMPSCRMELSAAAIHDWIDPLLELLGLSSGIVFGSRNSSRPDLLEVHLVHNESADFNSRLVQFQQEARVKVLSMYSSLQAAFDTPARNQAIGPHDVYLIDFKSNQLEIYLRGVSDAMISEVFNASALAFLAHLKSGLRLVPQAGRVPAPRSTIEFAFSPDEEQVLAQILQNLQLLPSYEHVDYVEVKSLLRPDNPSPIGTNLLVAFATNLSESSAESWMRQIGAHLRAFDCLSYLTSLESKSISWQLASGVHKLETKELHKIHAPWLKDEIVISRPVQSTQIERIVLGGLKIDNLAGFLAQLLDQIRSVLPGIYTIAIKPADGCHSIEMDFNPQVFGKSIIFLVKYLYWCVKSGLPPCPFVLVDNSDLARRANKSILETGAGSVHERNIKAFLALLDSPPQASKKLLPVPQAWHLASIFTGGKWMWAVGRDENTYHFTGHYGHSGLASPSPLIVGVQALALITTRLPRNTQEAAYVAREVEVDRVDEVFLRLANWLLLGRDFPHPEQVLGLFVWKLAATWNIMAMLQKDYPLREAEIFFDRQVGSQPSQMVKSPIFANHVEESFGYWTIYDDRNETTSDATCRTMLGVALGLLNEQLPHLAIRAVDGFDSRKSLVNPQHLRVSIKEDDLIKRLNVISIISISREAPRRQGGSQAKPACSPLLGLTFAGPIIHLHFNLLGRSTSEKGVEQVKSWIRIWILECLAKRLAKQLADPLLKAEAKWLLGSMVEGKLRAQEEKAPRNLNPLLLSKSTMHAVILRSGIIFKQSLSVCIRANVHTLLQMSLDLLSGVPNLPISQIDTVVIDLKKKRTRLTWTVDGDPKFFSHLLWLLLQVRGLELCDNGLDSRAWSEQLEAICQTVQYTLIDPQVEEQERAKKAFHQAELESKQAKEAAYKAWLEVKQSKQASLLPLIGRQLEAVNLNHDPLSAWQAHMLIDYAWRPDCLRTFSHDDTTSLSVQSVEQIAELFPAYAGSALLFFRAGILPTRAFLARSGYLSVPIKYPDSEYFEIRPIWLQYLQRAVSGGFWLQRYLTGLSLHRKSSSDEDSSTWKVRLYFAVDTPDDLLDGILVLDDFLYQQLNPPPPSQ